MKRRQPLAVTDRWMEDLAAAMLRCQELNAEIRQLYDSSSLKVQSLSGLPYVATPLYAFPLHPCS
jgi:hypothetical protein